MTMPAFTIQRLLESGVHFGHNTKRWNPKMANYIFGVRNGIHIINLEHTAILLKEAMESAYNVAFGGGRILFIGTKPQASEIVKESAKRCGQYYINHRWLGGTLTNWKTISNSIKRLKSMEEQVSNNESNINIKLTKKENLKLKHEYDKLEKSLGGIKDMGGMPDMLFIIDTNKEELAVQEAKKVNIPIIAILDSNSDPKNITYPIPGNDDSMKAITLYCEMISSAILQGLKKGINSSELEEFNKESDGEQFKEVH